jgi:hypothetical protein
VGLLVELHFRDITEGWVLCTSAMIGRVWIGG